jgi:high affinity sulfate transporter 1
MVAGYHPAWLPKDIMAGLVLTAILVPQGMAYAELAGLPPITGLYTSILCLVGYAALGPSRILVLGPDSSLGPMIAATILPLVGADGSPSRAIALASMLAILVGAMMILAGVAKLGFVADLLSKPTQIGYMTGLALTILVGQLPKLFGFSIHSDTLIGDITGFVNGVRSGETVTAAVLIGLFGLAVIVVLQRWLPKMPGVLVAVVLSIGAAVVFHLAGHGVSLVGTLPQGLPPFTIPGVSASDFGLLVAGALGISLVALTDTISTASAFAARSGDEVQANQEMIGIGTSNVAAGLFQGFPVSTSGSRTAVADQSGAKTQVTGLVGAGLIVLMLLVIPGLFRNLPQPTLAAVVMAAALSLADIAGLKRLWEVRRTEFALSLAAFLGVAVLGVLPGIGIAVGLSILNVFRRSWWPYSTSLGRVEGIPGYHDLRSYPDAERVDGLVVFRFDAPLFFANARAFREQVRELAVTQPRPRWIVVAAEPITDVDTTAADMLEDLD